MVTAFSGWMVFGEKLPGLWWVGAAGLVVGNVVIGRRDEEGDNSLGKESGVPAEGERDRRGGYRDQPEGSSTEISDGVELLGGESRKNEEFAQR